MVTPHFTSPPVCSSVPGSALLEKGKRQLVERCRIVLDEIAAMEGASRQRLPSGLTTADRLAAARLRLKAIHDDYAARVAATGDMQAAGELRKEYELMVAALDG